MTESTTTGVIIIIIDSSHIYLYYLILDVGYWFVSFILKGRERKMGSGTALDFVVVTSSTHEHWAKSCAIQKIE